MYHREHPPPHLHARYGGRKGTLRLVDGHFDGDLPARVTSLLLEWWDMHRQELAENWELAQNQKQLNRIPPLE